MTPAQCLLEPTEQDWDATREAADPEPGHTNGNTLDCTN